ncbi:MAG: glycoside hydrolase family 3 protein, partial [Flavobacteriales bacterium]
MTKPTYVFLLLAMILSACQSSTQNSAEDSSQSDKDDHIESLIAQMTLEEKIGQMTQLTLDMICDGQPYNLDEPHTLNTAKLDTVFNQLHVGSILNCGGHAYSREKWLDFHRGIKQYTDSSRLKIPVLYGIDAIHGVTYTTESTLFPQQINLAATWSPELVQEAAEMAGYEMRSSGIRWNFSPVLDIARDPRWPRFWETFGEDVLLASEMGTAMVKGYQGDSIGMNHGAACMKHFVGYSQTLSGKDRTAAWVSDRQLREYFLPSFKAAIDAGAMSIMINSGEINGIPVHVNSYLLNDVLRDELGFEGMAVSDWEDIKYLYTRHHVAKDYKDAIAMAINAGIDMSMVPVDYKFPVLLKELVEEGTVSTDRINDACRRVLKMKQDLGLFEHEIPSIEDYPEFASAEHKALALKVAESSVVLLKNEAILPFESSTKILLAGPNADDLNALNGGWTRTWQGLDTTFNTPGCLSIYEEMDKRQLNFNYSGEFPSNLKSASRNADVIVLALGEKPYTETVGDIEDIYLPQVQQDLIDAAIATGKPVVALLIEGRPRTFKGADELAAVIFAGLPGDYGAGALLNVLYGKSNPSAKLPFTYPRFASAHTCYDHKYTDLIDPQFGTDAFQPLFEFGTGLSYTTFSYGKLNSTQKTYSLKDTISCSIEVTNTGDLAGSETVQLYVS